MTNTIDANEVFSVDQIAQTTSFIESTQLESGMIPWFHRGHCDPWNHVEAAMALCAGGSVDAAARAYEWLIAMQLENGAWYAYYQSDGSIKDASIDTNATAYLATGIYHQVLTTGDESFLERTFPAAERAVQFVLRFQNPTGEISWSIDPTGQRSFDALLSASSSIYQSLCAAIVLGETLGRNCEQWIEAAARLKAVICTQPEVFLAKDEYAMDAYYPVLSGAITGVQAEQRMNDCIERFVDDGRGVLCRSDRRWVTTAETAECCLALMRIDRVQQAQELLQTVHVARDLDGSYATGIVYPEHVEFPHAERTTYSGAAVILAVDALKGGTASAVFHTEENAQSVVVF